MKIEGNVSERKLMGIISVVIRCFSISLREEGDCI